MGSLGKYGSACPNALFQALSPFYLYPICAQEVSTTQFYIPQNFIQIMKAPVCYSSSYYYCYHYVVIILLPKP